MKLSTLLLIVCLTSPTWAQDTIKFFRLDFVIKELDENKITSAKTYSTFMSTDDRKRATQIRTSNKIAYASAPNSFQFLDVGVNIDCTRLQELNGQLALELQAEVSSIPGGEIVPGTPPVIRQNRWNSTVLLPVGKPTTLFSSEDQYSKRKMQLELNVTAVK